MMFLSFVFVFGGCLDLVLNRDFVRSCGVLEEG